MIDIPEKGADPEEGQGAAGSEMKKGPEKTDDGVVLNDDGSFEIPTFRKEEETNASDNEEEEAAIIEKAEVKKDKENPLSKLLKKDK